MNLYAYVGGNPANAIDPLGLRYTVDGTSEEKALVESWLEKLKECAKCDKEFEERLKEVLEGPFHFIIRFRDGALAGGWNPDRGNEVRLDPTLQDPNSRDNTYGENRPFSLRELLFPTPSREGNYRGPDVLAHEMVGHGYDYSQGDERDNQGKAIALANLVRACIGKEPQR